MPSIQPSSSVSTLPSIPSVSAPPIPIAEPRPAARPARSAGTRTAKAKPAEIVLVCRRCARRVGLSPKAARRLAKAAARTAAELAIGQAAEAGQGAPGAKIPETKTRKAKIVETGCLGPCPKRLVAVATATGLAAGRVALLDPQADPLPALPDFGPNAALPAPAEAGTRGGAPDPARPRAPIPT